GRAVVKGVGTTLERFQPELARAHQVKRSIERAGAGAGVTGLEALTGASQLVLHHARQEVVALLGRLPIGEQALHVSGVRPVLHRNWIDRAEQGIRARHRLVGAGASTGWYPQQQDGNQVESSHAREAYSRSVNVHTPFAEGGGGGRFTALGGATNAGQRSSRSPRRWPSARR